MISEKQFLEYQKIIDDIVSCTGGEYDRMTDEEKSIIINISIELKEMLDEIYTEYYPVLCQWAALGEKNSMLN
ncbi:MAG: hypothetical protein JG776_2171 [Caloramator sp.]|jgi:hypothetical protein|uniref:hypothetical protein n=1 Tax=Caloramator sp. TaxID=1871330 RepID=UPI001DA2AACF|nr:hypothetical protein [Caloramator sp.]MBZ4664453.1 hypothetical protein [Caloramator sp.]